MELVKGIERGQVICSRVVGMVGEGLRDKGLSLQEHPM